MPFDFLSFFGLMMVCIAVGGAIKVLKDISKTLNKIESKMPKSQE